MGSTNKKESSFTSSWYEQQEEPRSSNRMLNTLMVYHCGYNNETGTLKKIQVAKIDWNFDGTGDHARVVHVRNQALWDEIPEDLKRMYIRKMFEYWKRQH